MPVCYPPRFQHYYGILSVNYRNTTTIILPQNKNKTVINR